MIVHLRGQAGQQNGNPNPAHMVSASQTRPASLFYKHPTHKLNLGRFIAMLGDPGPRPEWAGVGRVGSGRTCGLSAGRPTHFLFRGPIFWPAVYRSLGLASAVDLPCAEGSAKAMIWGPHWPNRQAGGWGVMR
jgi:hypothetical protein